jgi:tetratricopeptide (TPR) repeat protein
LTRERHYWTTAFRAFLVALVCLPASAQEVPEVVRATLEEADRLRSAGRAAEARARYLEVIESAPSLASAYVGLGAIAHAAGKSDEALEVFVKGLAHAPNDRTLLFNAGAVALQAGKPKDALGYVDRAIAQNEKDAALHSLRASILQRLDRSEDALAELTTVVRLDPDNARAHFNLGNVYFRMGRKAEAIEAFQKATLHDKSFVPAYYNLGAALFDTKRHDEALKAYEVALAPVDRDLAAGKAVEPSHARAYSNLGAIYSQRQSWDRALDAYKKAEKLDPASAAASYNIGYILYRMERFDEAYDAYGRAAKIDSKLPLANLHRGVIDAGRQRWASAIALLDQALPHVEGNDRRLAFVTRARAYRAQGEDVKARADYETMLETNTDDIDALVGLGRLLRESGQIAEARVHLERARKAVLDSSGVALELAALAKAEGDRGKEKSLYMEVLKREGDRPEMWSVRLSLAVLLAGEGASVQARQEIEALLKRQDALKGTDARKLVHTAYGMLLARDGDREGAMRELEIALKEDRTFAPAQTAQAVLNALSGNLEAAQTGLRSAVGGTGFPEVRLLARLDLGKVLWLLGKPVEAKPHLEAAADAFPDDAGAQAALGEIALAAGDRAAAVKRLGAAVESCETKGRPVATGGSRSDGVLRFAIGPDQAVWLCPRAKQVLGHALVATSIEALDKAVRDGGGASAREAREGADRALDLHLEPAARQLALFVKGSASLILDDVRGARRDLAAALAGDLPAGLLAIARNNLGAALYRDGAVEEAQQQFEAARAARPALQAAMLNLAIALHGKAGGQPKALSLYEEYVSAGGARKEDAQKWAESLRRVYR